MTELGGTRALVTGATSGLGLAMARALVRAGASVAITSRDAERAARVAAELGRAPAASRSTPATSAPSRRAWRR